MQISRRDAVGRMLGAAALAMLPVWKRRAAKPFPHPDPRPGVTAEHVIAADQLERESLGVRDAYAAARRWPGIFDGLYCACECSDSMGHRSLLACFESMQPTGCASCQQQAHVAARLIEAGKSLADIRREFDARWG